MLTSWPRAYVVSAIWAVLLHALGCAGPYPEDQEATRRLLVRLGGEAEMFVIVTHQLPEADIHGLIGQLAANDLLDADCIRNYPGIEKGIDSWGRELVVEVQNRRVLKLRSKGPDGVDNAGSNDDIEVSVALARISQRAD